MGCNNPHEECDYREPYTGEFAFTTIKKSIRMCYDTLNTCIDGWRMCIENTSTYNSFIETIDTNKLVIQIGKRFFGENTNDSISKTFYPILYQNGDLFFPTFPTIGNLNISGHFIGYDSLIITLELRYGMGGYSVYDVVGVRND